ncbi:MAG: histone deacetylase [Spirochaetia bacterium]|nr:histone deacetylase [Spirochaetia bacterium]
MQKKTPTGAELPVFIYSDEYDMDLGPHVFPSVKFGFIYRRLKSDPRFAMHRFIEPVAASVEEAGTVHSPEYLQDLTTLTMSPRVSRSEIPLIKPLVDTFFLAVGGTVLAARTALTAGRAMNLTGGFHHAFGDHAEGFCYLNDVAIAIRLLQKEGLVKNVAIIDLDVHQGNGTAKIFQDDPSVFALSLHEENNYPVKERGTLDVGLRSGCHDDEYLQALSNALEKLRAAMDPDLIFYLAGVDTFERDRLGGLSLSREGMAARDRLVRDFMPTKPLAAVLAGGYAIDTDDTVALHVQTAEVLAGLR